MRLWNKISNEINIYKVFLVLRSCRAIDLRFYYLNIYTEIWLTQHSTDVFGLVCENSDVWKAVRTTIALENYCSRTQTSQIDHKQVSNVNKTRVTTLPRFFWLTWNINTMILEKSLQLSVIIKELLNVNL